MARRFQNRLQRSSGSRPNRSWAGAAPSAVYSNVAASAKVLLGGFALSNTNIDETVLRTVGSLGVRTDNLTATVTEEQHGAFGMIVVSDAAVAVGVTAIPGPITDRTDDGWFVYVPFTFSSRVEAAGGFNPDLTHMLAFDSKAKRVVEEGQQIAIMIENLDGSDAFDVIFLARLLSQVRGTR